MMGKIVRTSKGLKGLVLEVLQDEFYGETVKVLFFDGTFSEWETGCLAVITPLKSGGYAVDPPKRLHGRGWATDGRIPR